MTGQSTTPPISCRGGFVVAVVALLAVDLASRLVSLSAGPFLLQFDALNYWELGGQMAGGDWLIREPPSAFRTPLYPAYVACWRLVAGRSALQGAIVGQHLMGVATSLLTGWMCARLTGNRWMFAAGYLLSLLCLGRLQLDNLLMSEPLFTLLLTGHAALVVLWCQRPRRRLALAAGAVLGLSVLARPTAQWLWVAELPVLYFGLPATGRRGEFLRQAGLLVGGCLLAVAPWLLRNQAVYGEPFLTRGTGIRLWAAVFSPAGANLDLPPGGPADRLAGCNWRHEWTAAGTLHEQGMGEEERDRWMSAAAVEAIRRRPEGYAAGVVRNWFAYWYTVDEAVPWSARFDPASAADDFQGQSVWTWPALEESLRPLLRFGYRYSRLLSGAASALALLGAGLMLLRGPNRLAGLTLLLAFLYLATVTAVVIVPLYRFRGVAEPLLITAAVAGFYPGCAAVCRRWSADRDRDRAGERLLREDAVVSDKCSV
jgi:hypothetical protein